MEQTQEIIEKMGYEGVSPPTIKKLLPPYWHFLAHYISSYTSGSRVSANEISLLNTCDIATLVEGLDFNLY